MAKDDERPQFNPKHRIAGAIILVSLAVIFVPMLLDESTPAKENQVLTEIPARDASAAETKVVVTPVPASEPVPKTPELSAAQVLPASPAPDKPAADALAPPVAPKTQTAKVEASEAKTKVTKVEKKSEARAKPVAAKTGDLAEKISKGWIVQVGTFGNADNADRLRDKLKDQGFAVSAESVTFNGGKAVRLRVGPFRDKSAATRAQSQLQKELNIKGMVLAYP